jgi:hypothetical protein
VYKALGLAYELKGFYHKALDTDRKAVQINPNYWPAVGNLGDILVFTGNLAEGIRWRAKSVRLDPTVAASYVNLAKLYGRYLADDFSADKYFKQAFELQPELPGAYDHLYSWHFDQGHFEEASHDNEKLFSYDHDTVSYDNKASAIALFSGNISQARKIAYKLAARGDSSYLAYFFWREGKMEVSRNLFNAWIAGAQKVIDQGHDNPRNSYHISRWYAIQDEKKQALLWLRKAIDDGWREYRYAMMDPYLRSVRNDEQFKQMLSEVRTDVEEQKKRLAEMEKEESR